MACFPKVVDMSREELERTAAGFVDCEECEVVAAQYLLTALQHQEERALKRICDDNEDYWRDAAIRRGREQKRMRREPYMEPTTKRGEES